VWAVCGALLLGVSGLLSWRAVAVAVGRGTDVYLFLTGMMVLAELARREGVFDWVASHSVRASHGSRWRLFGLVYGVGIVVTTVLSNDATAVVLTPAVAAAVRKAKAEPLPYLFACAFIANAASFVLPISNPANLVVFADRLPTLGRWLVAFALPSLLSIGATYLMLALASRRSLTGSVATDVDLVALKSSGRITLVGIVATAVVLVIASSLGAPLGVTTCTCGAIVFAVVTVRDRAAVRDVATSISWSVLLLVAGLFVLVAGMDATGLLDVTRHAVEALLRWPPWAAVLAAGGVPALAANAMNNLPAGLIAGSSATSLHGHDAVRSAIAVGIDLGPNLSVTGSLATVLWLIALRRESIAVDAWTFLRTGILVMPPALLLALESILVTMR